MIKLDPKTRQIYLYTALIIAALFVLKGITLTYSHFHREPVSDEDISFLKGAIERSYAGSRFEEVSAEINQCRIVVKLVDKEACDNNMSRYRYLNTLDLRELKQKLIISPPRPSKYGSGMHQGILFSFVDEVRPTYKSIEDQTYRLGRASHLKHKADNKYPIEETNNQIIRDIFEEYGDRINSYDLINTCSIGDRLNVSWTGNSIWLDAVDAQPAFDIFQRLAKFCRK